MNNFNKQRGSAESTKRKTISALEAMQERDKNTSIKSLQTGLQNMNESLSSLQSSLQVTSAQLASLQNRLDSVNSNITSMNMNTNNKREVKPGLASRIIKVITLPFRLIGKIKKQIRDVKYFIYIKRSGQFNNEWYLGNNPDVAKKFRSSFWHKLDETKIPLLSQFGKFMAHPLMHYIKCGCYEHRKPTAYFDGDEYCLKYSDVDVRFINPFYHYLKFGIAEGRTHSLEQFIKDSKAQLHKSLGIRSYFLQPEDKVKTDFTSKKIAVHLHLYYVDLADEMIAYLKNIPANFDLYISVIDQDCNSIAKRFKDSIPLLNSVKVKNVPNRGRDLAPFLLTFGKELLKYDYCCHIHSKKSVHNNALKGWRKYLLSNLLGSSEQITGILNLLIRDGKFVFPRSYLYTSDVTNWGGNFQIACDFFAGRGLSIQKYQIVEFPQGSMFWCRSNCLKRLMQLNLKWTDFPEEPIGADGSLAHVLERSFLILADDIEGFAYSLCNYDNPEQSNYYEDKQCDFSKSEKKYSKVKLLTYYLPQFHPTPENDLWHGKGFTEWTSTKSANPLFTGHYQQHIPHSDTGFYLLDNTDILKKQADMMKKSGIYGQIFYHYWFTGKLILEKPVQMLLANKDIDMPFCFCWANENWTKCWDGNEREILLEQRYSVSDAEKFINYLIPFFKDPRYIKVNNRPVLFIYRISSFPYFEDYKEVWDRVCTENGLEKPYLVATLNRGVKSPKPYNADAAVERVLHDWTNGNVPEEKHKLHQLEKMTGSVLDYSKVAEYYIGQEKKLPDDFTLFRSIVPQWDNTARYHERALLLHKSTPGLFGNWLKSIIEYSEEKLPEEECFAVINAWNEWAEGAHLEPDTYYGYSYLNTVGRILHGIENFSAYKDLAVAKSKKKVNLQIVFSPVVCKTLSKNPVQKRKILGCLERSIRFLSEKGDFSCYCENFESELFAGKKCENFDIKVNIFNLCLFREDTLWEIYRTNILYPNALIMGKAVNSTENIVILTAESGRFITKHTQYLKNTHLFLMHNEDAAVPEKKRVATIIRLCASNKISLLENGLLSLLAQKDCRVKVYLCLQDFDKEALAKIKSWIGAFPWEEGDFPELLPFYSSEENKDLRALLLHEGLKRVSNDFYVTFLDYDDIIFADGYASLLQRLIKTRTAVAFARVYQTMYSVADSSVIRRTRLYEYGYSYDDFYNNNFAPIHSFMIDRSKIDVENIKYKPGMKYMEDYCMMLQILTPYNGDYELLQQNRYIGDYICFTDSNNTLAGNKTVQEWLKNMEYVKCHVVIDDLRSHLKKRFPEVIA